MIVSPTTVALTLVVCSRCSAPCCPIIGGIMQANGYEKTVFMPAEREEDMAQLHLGVHFLRLGAWDDRSSVS